MHILYLLKTYPFGCLALALFVALLTLLAFQVMAAVWSFVIYVAGWIERLR